MTVPRPAFPGGIRPPRVLEQTRDLAIRQMAFAPLLSLPLRQHAGAAALAVVREGEDVDRGSLLARAGDATSLPLHAPASGRILRIDTQRGEDGTLDSVIRLAPFPGSTQECGGGSGCDPVLASPAAIVAAIRDAGIVALDASGPSAHWRWSPSNEKPPRLVLLNGIASDAYLTRDSRILREQTADVVLGVRYLLKATGAAQAILAVEPQDEDAARAAVATAPAALPFRVRVLAARYPQAAEPLLVAAVLGEPLRGDPRPQEPGVLCLDVATVAEIGRLLPLGRGSTDVVLTLAGGSLEDPGNYRVPLGTPYRFALEQAGLRPDVSRVLDGGPLRGRSLASLDAPVTKRMLGLVALDRSEAGAGQHTAPCIRCGDCLDACPVRLNPAEMGLLARKGEWQALGESHRLDLCLECGCCAYVCPSRIPLVQLFRAGKARLDRAASAGLAP